MADAEVEFLLVNLGRLRDSGILSRDGIDQFEMLWNVLPLLKAFLRDSTKKRLKGGNTVPELVRQIRDLIYNAQDIVDKLSIKNLTFIFDKIHRTAISRLRFKYTAMEIKLINKEVRALYGRQNVLDFASPDVGGDRGPEEQEVKLIAKLGNVVGFEDEVDTIIDHLKEERDELDVICIIGMPGLGKTTLAQKIFQEKEVEYHFPTRFWVDVSYEFNLRDFLLQILKGVADLDVCGIADQDLAQAVCAYLEGGQFLLVIDAVWTVEAWNAIRKVLPKGNREGKVLITSRNRNVAIHANPTRKPLNLRFLSVEESWELLQLEVFGKLDKCPRELEGIGRNIARICDGVPLAIRMIGGVLANHFSTTQPIGVIHNEWDKVSTCISANYNMEHGGSKIIASSYDKLPDELRDCFLYLGVFPEDYEIPAWTLTRLWIAEGFIQHKEGQSLEETAEDYLNDLVNRNLVMVKKTNLSGEVKTCRVHNVIREFCNSKSGIREQNFFQEIKMSGEGVFNPPVSDIENYRRLCIHAHLSEFLSQKELKGPVVRSLLCFHNEPVLLEEQYASVIPNAFNLLRVLESKSVTFRCFPSKMLFLVHLRYITLSIDFLKSLPKFISKFWNLQTVQIDTKSRTLEIGASLWKLSQLRHLKTKASLLLAKRGEASLVHENLQTLTSLSPEYCTQKVFSGARNIKRLGIRGKLATLLKGDYSLASLDCLENLKMVNDLPHKSALENPLCGLPQLNFFPLSLKRLTLSATYLDWSQMSTLGRIISLQVLKLKDNAFTGQNWNADGHGFRTLEILLISSADLVSWKAVTADFPVLECLVLKNCMNLREIPTGLAKSLRKLSLHRIGKSALECAEEIKRKSELSEGIHKARRGRVFELNIGPGCDRRDNYARY